jgi:hypothetical protein
MPVVGYAAAIQVKELSVKAIDDYAWCDPAMARIFQSRGSASTWAIAWVHQALIAPLAIVVPGGLLHPPQLIHLVESGIAHAISD